MKRALITGITGQDGSYLAELLLSKGYEVHGIVRRSSTFNTDRIDHIYRDPHDPETRMFLHYGDLSDGTVLRRILEGVQPEEVYNLGAQSHVQVSFQEPEYTADVVGIGTLRLLEGIRDYQQRAGKQVRFYQAGSSEMFGATHPPQSESTAFYPRSPYAVSKVSAYWYAVNYREAYGMFIANGILFNHESPRRGETFVTRKVTRAVGRIKFGLQDILYLGNLDAKRDWGFAGDYVEGMWRMLQHSQPDDFVLATGRSYSVREFVEEAFTYAGLVWTDYVRVDSGYLRPTEVDHLLGDPSKAKRDLGWEPTMDFNGLVASMLWSITTWIWPARSERCGTRAISTHCEVWLMRKDAKIYIAGHRGLVGSAIHRRLEQDGYTEFLLRTRTELDLTDPTAVDHFFNSGRPEYVFLAAAKVGGILANDTSPADFIRENLQIELNVIDAAHRYGVEKLLFLGSSCIYPKFAEQPIREEALLTGALEPTNDAYAVAKIAGIQLCQSYRKQHSDNFISVMPTNLYGPGDNFDPFNSHVLPALIRRFHEAKVEGSSEVVIWGTGMPRREFLHVDDLADACLFLMDNYDDPSVINVGVGEDISIMDLARLVAEIVGYIGNINNDTSKPDGTPRKLLDVRKLKALGWEARIELQEGIAHVYEWYLSNVAAV